MALPTKRSSAVKIMLHPDMHRKLVDLAEALGQTPATLASFAVGLYVAQQTSAMGATGRAIDKMVGELAPQLQKQLEGL